MAKKQIHTVPRVSKWANEVPGNQRASGVYNTQKEAVDAARAQAKRQKLEHLIHGTDGKIRERNSYERDPYPPVG